MKQWHASTHVQSHRTRIGRNELQPTLSRRHIPSFVFPGSRTETNREKDHPGTNQENPKRSMSWGEDRGKKINRDFETVQFGDEL